MTKLLVIAGPTAVGKTKFAIDIAVEFDGEIVSCDSMQLYKYMNIGSAKPTPKELAMVPHHLVDIVDPREDFSVAHYRELALAAIEDISSRGKLPIVSGGTGLYLNSLLYNMDFAGADRNPELRQELWRIADECGGHKLYEMLKEKDPAATELIHPNNTKRIVRALERIEGGEGSVKPFSEASEDVGIFDAVEIALTRDRELLYERINQRVDILIEEGLVAEVEELLKMGLTVDNISMKGIGYKEIIQYINGEYGIEEAVATVKKNTRHYAKKQLTWFRRYDKMRWYNVSAYEDDEAALKDIKKWLRTRI